MIDSDDELAARRLEALGAHFYSGDEWNLLAIGTEDLGLPLSTRDAKILSIGYEGGLAEIARAPHAVGEVAVEYGFSLSVGFEASMAVDDASTNGWAFEEQTSELAIARASLDMTAVTGVVYTGDEVTGFIEYARVRRADGTPASPVGMLNDDARVLEFPHARDNAEDQTPGPPGTSW